VKGLTVIKKSGARVGGGSATGPSGEGQKKAGMWPFLPLRRAGVGGKALVAGRQGDGDRGREKRKVNRTSART